MHRTILTYLALTLSTSAFADCGKDGKGPDCSKPPADFIIGSPAGFLARPKADSRGKRAPRRKTPVIPTEAGYDNLQRRVDALVAAKDCNAAKAMALKGGALAMATRTERLCNP